MARKEEKVEEKEKKKGEKESDIVTKESLCATFALFSFLALLILCTRSVMFGNLGLAIHTFLVGVFGYLAYPLSLGVLYLSIMGLIGKRLVKNRRGGVCLSLTLLCIALILHCAFSFSWEREGYIANCFYAGENFPACTVCGWLGGMIVFCVSAVMSNIGTIVFLSLLTVFFGYLFVISLQLPKKEKAVKPAKEKMAEEMLPQPETVQPAEMETHRYEPVVEQQPMVRLHENTDAQKRNDPIGSYSPFGGAEMARENGSEKYTPTNSRDLLFGGDPSENFRRNLIFDPNSNANKRSTEETPVQSTYVPSYSNAYQNAVNEETVRERPVMIFTDQTQDQKDDESDEPIENEITPMSYLEEEKPVPQETLSYPIYEPDTVSEEPKTETFGFSREEKETLKEEKEEYKRHDYMDLFSPSNERLFEEELPKRTEEVFGRNSERSLFEERDDSRSTRGFEEETRTSYEEETRSDALHIFDDKPEEDDPYSLRSESDFTREVGRDRDFSESIREERNLDMDREFTDRSRERGLDMSREFEDRSERADPITPTPSRNVAPEPPKMPKPRIIKPYKRVPLDDFDCRDIEPMQNPEEVEETKQTIIATLEDFKVMGASIASVTFGPTVTRYNVALPRSISPRKIVALDQSIAISLHSNGVNIYPNYEDGVVSIEVPNKERQFVQLGCMLSGNTFVNSNPGSLMFAMGKNVANSKVYGDISKMIHLLVAGSSGSGKSVFLGALIVSMIYKYSPEELRLILIDPKKTEFVLYNNLPHLMINEIITDVNKAVQSLNWAIGEMNRRYSLFEQMSRSGKYVVNLDQYNEQLEKNERLPKIVIIIDELADLMLAAKKEIEDRIQNLTQKARAAGIHLIVATQRPSTDVITGVIKSNLATRIAFYVATDVDSRVILDQSGAQKLLGKGDFLYTMPGLNTPVRVQSAFISPADSQKVVNFIKANNEAYYDEEATAYINNTRVSSDDPLSDGGRKEDTDPMFIEALRQVILTGSASISMIQRKCSAGYNRAGRIIEWMEEKEYISPFDGAKARRVLITKEEFESQYGPL